VNSHGYLVSADETYTKREGLTIIDCRAKAEYLRGHISGAINFDVFKHSWRDTSINGLREFTRRMESEVRHIGIRADRPVVAYDDISGSFAARGAWNLLYLGHEEVMLLDGGLSSWTRSGFPTQKEPPEIVPSDFFARPREEFIAGRDLITAKSNDEKVRVIDTRSLKEYIGAKQRAQRTGKIPKAIHIDWQENLTSEGLFESLETLKKLYDSCGVSQDKEVITYCQGGYRAAHTFLALKMLGYQVRNYIGSWAEWGNTSELPVEGTQV